MFSKIVYTMLEPTVRRPPALHECKTHLHLASKAFGRKLLNCIEEHHHHHTQHHQVKVDADGIILIFSRTCFPHLPLPHRHRLPCQAYTHIMRSMMRRARKDAFSCQLPSTSTSPTRLRGDRTNKAFITVSSQRRIPTIFATSCMGMVTIMVWLHFFLRSIDDAGTPVSAAAATLYGRALQQEESTQNHHNTSPCPRKVDIKGERHTGTNWVTSIINKNLGEDDEKVIDEGRHGWKHGFYPPIGVGAPFYRDEVRVVGK